MFKFHISRNFAQFLSLLPYFNLHVLLYKLISDAILLLFDFQKSWAAILISENYSVFEVFENIPTTRPHNKNIFKRIRYFSENLA